MSLIRKRPRKELGVTSTTQHQKPYTQRRLKTKPVLIIMAILLLGNLLWFIAWLIPSKAGQEGNDQVATVDGETITRQQWIAEMESLYGKDTLKGIVNEAVVEKAASKYNIKVSDEEIDMEIALMRSAQDQYDTSMQNLTNKQLRQKIRSQLIFEKVLTKDVIIDEEKTKAFYDDNTSLFNTKTTYQTNIIVVASEGEAKSVLTELENGSSFSVLARERSLDTASASLGGNIGFVSEDEQTIDSAITKALNGMKVNEVSGTFVMNDGRYGIVQVSDIVKGQSFSYKEVKDHIERELALEQLPQTVTTEALWSEFNASWFYEEEEK